MFLNDFFQFNPFNFLEKVFMYFISKRDIKLRFRENSDKIMFHELPLYIWVLIAN